MLSKCRRANFLRNGNCFKQEYLCEKKKESKKKITREKKKVVMLHTEKETHKKIEDVHFVHILAVQNSCKNKIANCKIS